MTVCQTGARLRDTRADQTDSVQPGLSGVGGKENVQAGLRDTEICFSVKEKRKLVAKRARPLVHPATRLA